MRGNKQGMADASMYRVRNRAIPSENSLACMKVDRFKFMFTGLTNGYPYFKFLSLDKGKVRASLVM